MLERAKDSVLGHLPMSLIPNGVDLDVFGGQDRTLARAELGLPLDAKIVLFVANDAPGTPWKGMETLVEAFAEAARRADGNLILCALGGQMGLPATAPPVRFLPFEQSERVVASYFAAADVYAHAAEAENAPLVVLEAMASGLPVVAADAGGISEQLGPSSTAVVSRVGDRDQFASDLIEVLADPALRERLGATNRVRAQIHYGLKLMLDRYVRLYEEVLAP